MSTPNFRTQENFKLYVDVYRADEDYIKEWAEENECDVSEFPYADDSYFYYEDVCDNFKYELQAELEKSKRNFQFYELTLISGYYDGVQMYVEEKHPYFEDYDNEDSHYYFDTCKSLAKRQRQVEYNQICKIMDNIAKNLGFEEIVCVGIFSNGEAIYEKADTLKAKLCKV